VRYRGTHRIVSRCVRLSAILYVPAAVPLPIIIFVFLSFISYNVRLGVCVCVCVFCRVRVFRCRGCCSLSVCVCVCVTCRSFHIIQLTPQKLSAELKNRHDVKVASAWPEDQSLHRRRRPGRRRYQEVILLEQKSRFFVFFC